jgi:transposase
MDRIALEKMLGDGLSLEAIGRQVGRHESTVAYWVRKYGLRAANWERHVARGGLQRSELEALIAEGKSIAEIAEVVGRGKATVRHWLRQFGLSTHWAERRVASGEGTPSLELRCARHGLTTFRLRGTGGYRCAKCRSEAVVKRRRKVKRVLVQEAGGACSLCGYSTNMRALHFHHLEPAEKRLELSSKGVALSIETLRTEAQKCVLLCSNCHAEVEDGVATVPSEALAGHPPG